MNPYVAGIVFFLVLQWVAALLRVFVRVFMVKRFGWDDAAMLMTLLLSSSYCSLSLAVAATTGLRSVPDILKINPSALYPAMRMTLALMLSYIWASVFLKIALALLLLRILVATWQRVIIHVTMGVSIAYGIFYFLFVLLQCGPPADFPDRILLGQCLSATAIDGTSIAHAAWNALADLIYLCLPIALLWKADLGKRAKVSVGCILGVGSFGGICTVVRIAYIHTLTRPTLTYFQTSKLIALMSAAELSIGLTCICLSTYKPLVRFFFPRDEYYYYGDSTDRRSQSSGGGQEMAQMHASPEDWQARRVLDRENGESFGTLDSQDHERWKSVKSEHKEVSPAYSQPGSPGSPGRPAREAQHV